MIIRYIGHSCFFISSAKGTSVITDPYGTYLPYKFPVISADAVLISHEHRDHNADWRIGGNPKVVKRTCDYLVEHEIPIPRTGETLVFTGVPCFHDNFSGRRKGPNTLFIWDMDGIRICHLGDLGHLLGDQHMKFLTIVDILFLPVGGKTVLAPTEATLLVSHLNPRLVIPMHYKTPVIENLGIVDEPVESFLGRVQNVEHLHSMALEIEVHRLPSQTKTVVLNYE